MNKHRCVKPNPRRRKTQERYAGIVWMCPDCPCVYRLVRYERYGESVVFWVLTSDPVTWIQRPMEEATRGARSSG